HCLSKKYILIPFKNPLREVGKIVKTTVRICIELGYDFCCVTNHNQQKIYTMSALFYALLIALNLVTSATEFDQLPPSEQQNLMSVIIDDHVM
ncbi:MAG: hypothetical protein AAFN92_13635, partial [Bacteroidota bacterium]